jgi:magnesium-protoporphyrin IX monomethyl ester (oxidative) cyclase
MRYEDKPIHAFFPDADVIGLSINWDFQKDAVLQVLRQIPAGSPVILGGLHATKFAEEYLNASSRVDLIVRGEGEVTIREYLSGKDLTQIEGISFRKNGRIVHNPSRSIKPISDIYPDRALRRHSYHYCMPLGIKVGIDTVLSSRGCAYNCEFCTFKFDHLGRRRGWSGRLPDEVVDEIESIQSEVIIFTDDDFSHKIKRVEKICDLIISRGIKKVLCCEMRIEMTKYPHILEKMQRAGFKVLSFGIETCKDKTFKRMGKGYSVKRLKEAFDVFRRYDFTYLGYFLVGYIGENEQDMLDIAPFAQSLGFDYIGVTSLRAFDNSGFKEIVEKTPGYHIDESNRVFSDRYSLKDLSRIKKKVLSRFYSPSHLLKLFWNFVRNGKPRKVYLKIIFGLILTEFACRKFKKAVGYIE